MWPGRKFMFGTRCEQVNNYMDPSLISDQSRDICKARKTKILPQIYFTELGSEMPASFLGCLRLHGHEPRISVARESFLLEQLGWENAANRQKETHTKERESLNNIQLL